MVSREETSILVESELEGAAAWAERNGIQLDWVPENLEIRAVLAQPGMGERFYLRGTFEDYRELPPVWTFTDEGWAAAGQARFFPQAGPTPFGSSIFHSNVVICAPFNRLAFGQHGGPHSDWPDTAQWLSAGAGYVNATTVGDMLLAVWRDLLYSRGRMG